MSERPQDRYNKAKTTTVLLRLNKSTDADVINALDQQPNKSGYIKLLIREDIKRRGKNMQESNQRKYIVVDDALPYGDSWTDVYNTAEEANRAARHDWDMLTTQEQRKRHIWAGLITLEDLGDDAIDEDTGAINWRCWVNADTFPGAFDSAGKA